MVPRHALFTIISTQVINNWSLTGIEIETSVLWAKLRSIAEGKTYQELSEAVLDKHSFSSQFCIFSEQRTIKQKHAGVRSFKISKGID